jgi:photosystem II stability/assembly factor-like uncharacterized protein
MKKKLYYIVVTTIILINVAVSAYVIMKIGSDKTNQSMPVKKTVPNNNEANMDNPQAKAEYDLMRLNDPATGKIPYGIRSKELKFAAKLPKKYDARINAKDRTKNIQMQTWNQRGPYDVGGRTRALGIDIASENRIIAGGVSGGMWLSTDTGQTWMQTTSSSQLHSVSCVGQDTRTGHQNVWYYGTGERDGNSATGENGASIYLGDGIYKSIDSGLTWTVLPSTANDSPQVFNNNFDYVWKVQPFPFDTVNDVVFAATYGHIYRSMDGGTSWASVLGASGNISAWTDFDISPNGIIYAQLSPSLSQGIYRSADSGSTWTNITPVGWPGTFHRTLSAIAPSNENAVYFLSETPGSGKLGHNLWKYTYISGDGSGAGGSWTNISSSIPALGGSGNYDSQGSYDMVLRVKPDNDSVVFLGGTNIYRSTNGFADTTTTLAIGGYNLGTTNIFLLGIDGVYPNHHPDQHNLAFFPSNTSKMLTSNDGGVQLTYNNLETDSVHWIRCDNGLYTSQFYTIAIDHATVGDNIIIGGMQDNGNFFTNSTNPNVNWLPISGADGTYSAIADGKAFYYGSIQSGLTGRLNISNTGVVNVLTLARIDPTGGAGYLFINPFILDPDNNNRMYMAGGSYLWRNDSLSTIPAGIGTTTHGWTKISRSNVGGSVSAIGVSKNQPNVVYFGTSGGRIYRIDGANIGDPDTIQCWRGKGLPAGFVSCLAVNPDDLGTVVATFSNYNMKSVFITHDGGSTWNSISGNLEQNPDGSGDGPSVRWCSIVPTQDSIYYFLGTSTGVYSTTQLNGDNTVWTQEGANTIGNVVVDYIDFRQVDGLVVVATHGNGVFSCNLANPSGIKTQKNPVDFSINNTYPNPFSNSINITYTLNNTSQVSLKIMDMDGREISTLENKILQPGTYTYTWDGKTSNGSQLSDGIYYATLTADNKSVTKKVVLMR